MRYVWLVYLCALFYQPVLNPSTGFLDWLAVAVLIALFLPIYAATFRVRNDRQILIVIAGLGALAFAGSLVNSGASVFAIYAAAIASRLYPVRRAVKVVAVLVGVVALMVVVSPVPMPWRLAALGPALLFTPVVGRQASSTRSGAGRTGVSCAPTRRLSGWRRSPNESESRETCTTCSGIPCRSSC